MVNLSVYKNLLVLNTIQKDLFAIIINFIHEPHYPGPLPRPGSLSPRLD